MESNSNFYKYKVFINMLIPNEPAIPFDNINIGDLQIERDYDGLFFPIFSVTLFFETELYYKFIKNKSTVKFDVRIERYLTDKDNKTSSDRKIITDAIYTTFITDNDPDINKDLYKLADDSSLGNQTPHKGKYIELFLFKEWDIYASRRMLNAVIEKGNMTDVLVFLLSKSMCRNIVMGKIENTDVYNEILLLPTTTIQNILYLEKQYGFFKNGSILFFDIDVTYLIPKSVTNNVYKSGEYEVTVLNCYRSIQSESIMSGSYDDPVKKIHTIYINPNNISFESSALVDEQVVGSDVVMVDSSTNQLSTISPNIQDKNYDNNKVIVNAFSNKFLSSMIENKKVEDSHKISAVIYDFDMSAITPNKQFMMRFNDNAIQQSHGGKYRLSSSRILLAKQGEDYMISGQILLKKPL